jgi:PadR family transcriptional regulator PadR
MRRKAGALVPLETEVCEAAAEMAAAGTAEFHGYELAKQLAAATDRKGLAAYGTLYRALARLVEMGMLSSRWEDPADAADQNRPRRRFYALTTAGRATARQAQRDREATLVPRRARKGWAPA